MKAINRFTFLGGIMLPLTYALSFVAPGSGLRFKLRGDTGIAFMQVLSRAEPPSTARVHSIFTDAGHRSILGGER
ncbi:MAG: hypothetical protein QXQ90_07840 [Desulfurococcaceae archaeon]